MFKRKWLEPILIISALAIFYFSPIFSSSLPVFSGEFNNIDGSLYAVRFFDVLISFFLVTAASRYFIPQKSDLSTILKTIIWVLLTLSVAGLLETGWDNLVLHAFNLPTAPGEISDKMLAFSRRETLDLSIFTGNLLVLAVGLFYGLVLDRSRQLRRQETLEREHLEAEVKYLRSQINPHFLFNTLNNIFAITKRNRDQEGSDALLRLSGLMRYMLYESSGKEIELNQEIEHLENYRDLMLLKYNNASLPAVEFEIGSIPDHCLVAPLIFLPFVENAFKHGINNHGEGFIQLELKVEDHSLYFSLSNSLFDLRIPSGEHSGIGLENVKTRLKHLYPGRHDLKIVSDENSYRITLTIDL